MSDFVTNKELDENTLELIVNYKAGSSSNSNVDKEMIKLKDTFFKVIEKMPDVYKNALEDRFLYKLTEKQIAKKTNLDLDEVQEILAEGLVTYKKNIDNNSIVDVPVAKKPKESVPAQVKEDVKSNPPETKKVVEPKSVVEIPAKKEEVRPATPAAKPRSSAPAILGFFTAVVIIGIVFLLRSPFNFADLLPGSSTKSASTQINIQDSKDIKIVGSSSLSVLSMQWQKVFVKNYPEYKINVVSNESDTGINGLIQGSVDIANSSRPILYSDTQKANENGIELEEYRVAIDALVIVTNKENPIMSLTIEQLEKIFSGKVSNWNNLTSFNEPVLPIGREKGSGTNSFVKNRILSGKRFSYSIRRIYSDRDIMKLIAEKKGAISFINSTKYPWDMEKIKFINVQSYEGEEPIPPYISKKLNEDAIRYGDYPLAHYLYLAIKADSGQKVKDYINWVLSSEGQSEVRKLGLIPVN